MTSRHSVFASTRDPRVAIALIVAILCPASAFAQQPRGGQVVQGSATIATPTASTTTITQTSQRAIIDWQDFSIGAGGLVNINQPGAAAALLNRVTGGQLSVINGQLKANGRVYLINPQGIVVGPNGTIDTASFVGSTLNTSNEAFMSGGPLTFAGDSKAGVINLGTIRTAHGDVVIIAATIDNSGSILADAGTAALLSGSEVLYAPGGDTPFLIKAPVEGGNGAAIENGGVIRAAEAVLKSAGSAYAIAVNGGGEISATSIDQSGGRILIEGDGDITIDAGTTLRASAIGSGDGGSVVIKSGAATTFEGRIEAKGGAEGGDGGFAEVSGASVTFAGDVDLTAAAGDTGTFLIDPVSVDIDAPTAASIVTNLDTANFEVQADNDITVNAPIVNETTTNTLTLNAPTVVVNEDITMPAGRLVFDSSADTAVSVTSDASAAISVDSLGLGSHQYNTFAGPLLVGNSVSFDPLTSTVESFSATNAANEINNLYLTDGAVTVTGDVDVRSSTTMSVAFSLNVTGDLTLASGGDLLFENDTPGTFNVDGLTRLAATGSVTNLGNDLILGGAGRKLIYHSDAGGTNIGAGYTEVIGVAFPNDPLGAGNAIYIDDGSVLPLLTITADSKSKMYGDPEPSLTASFTGGSASDLTSLVQFRFDVPHTDVGVYTITPYGASSATHQLEYMSGTLTVTPAPLLITAPTMSSVYGSDIPAFTPAFSGLRNNDEPWEISGLVLTTTATPESSVGTYAIVPSGGVNSNYTITYANGSLNITAATLRVIANNASRLYGSADPVFSASFSGLVNGDTASVVSGLTFLTSATEQSSVGNYQIVGSGGSAENYEIQYVPGTLAITPAPLSVSTANASVTYGDPLPALTNTVMGLVAGDTVSSLGLNATSAYVQGTGVGSYLTTLLGSLTNYQVTYTPGVITVSPRPLFITANDATRFRLDANPAFTATISGLFGADQLNALSFATAATPNSQAGSYAIVPSVGAMPNYDVHLEEGTLEVQQIAPVIVTREFELTGKTTLSIPTGPVNDVHVFFSGTGLSAVLNNSPGVITRVLSAYESGVEGASGTGATLRYLMANNLSGEHNEVGKLLPFLVGEAKAILDRDPSTWSTEETKFITYMTEVISQQRKDAVENAAAQLADWKRQQQAVTDTQGMGSLIAVQDVPPDIFLQQAQSGISTNYEASATYAGLITAAAGTALATGVAASTLSSFTVVTAAMVSHSVAMSAGIAAGLEGAGAVAAGAKIAAASATAAGGLGGAAATFFIVAPLIAVVAGVTAGVVAAVNVANANDYDKKMNEAVAAAQKPMTTADLKAMLSSEGGQKTAYLSLVGQVAKNAADKKAMN